MCYFHIPKFRKCRMPLADTNKQIMFCYVTSLLKTSIFFTTISVQVYSCKWLIQYPTRLFIVRVLIVHIFLISMDHIVAAVSLLQEYSHRTCF